MDQQNHGRLTVARDWCKEACVESGYLDGWQSQLPWPGTRLPDLRATLFTRASPYGQVDALQYAPINLLSEEMRQGDPLQMNVTLTYH